MKKRVQKLSKKQSQRLYGLAFAAIFAVLGVALITFSQAATPATLSLSPASGGLGLGANVSVVIVENSGNIPVNAVQAVLKYDAAKLQYVNTDTSVSGFDSLVDSKGANGTVTLVMGNIPPALTGAQTVAKVNFKAIAPGAAAVTFTAGSSLLAHGTSANILTGTVGATYTIADTTKPSTPGGIKSPTKTATSIGLAWGASTDNIKVAGYNVYRNGVKVGSATAANYNDVGLSASTSYAYTVDAYDVSGNVSAKTAAVNLSTLPDMVAPSIPAGLAVGARTMNSLSLSWAASTDNVRLAGYKIYRNGVQVGTTATTNYTDAGLTPGTTYSYKVAAHDSVNNNSAQSTAVAAGTLADTVAPAVPKSLRSPSQTATGATLSWAASTDNVRLAGYKIYRNGVQVGTTATTNYTDAGLKSGSTISYVVAAYDVAGNTSAKSPAVLVTLKLKPGDVNGDNLVNISDLSILSANWGLSNTKRSFGDLNGDGVINIYDLSILCSNWGL